MVQSESTDETIIEVLVQSESTDETSICGLAPSESTDETIIEVLVQSESTDETIVCLCTSSSGGSSGSSIGFSSSSLASCELLSTEDSFWLRFDTITRIVGVFTDDCSLDWDISGAGLVLSGVSDSLLISESSLVSDGWD